MKALSKIIAIFGVGIIFTILLVVLVISPLLTEVTAINAKVREKKQELNVLDQQILAFKTAQADLARATRKDDILNAIPIKENLVSSVLDIERAAQLTNTEQTIDISELLTVAGKSTGKKAAPSTSKKPGIDEVTYDLGAVNDFTGLINFLSYIEHLPHFTELNSLSLTSEKTQAGESEPLSRTGKVLGNFKGVFFIQSVK